PSEIVVGTWSGAYGKAQQLAVMTPYTETTGIRVRVDTYARSGRDADRLKRDGAAADVLDMSSGALEAACAEGLLEAPDTGALNASSRGGPITEDFIAGGIAPCGIAS
ncbi:MAG TPA: hypothetical protein PK264_16335, partial [Hyphomicrobiaceae bacterium]|nr:hypothetical protein [Hyphomicrobiaceae bacterium]